jgi:hypothetical protein
VADCVGEAEELGEAEGEGVGDCVGNGDLIGTPLPQTNFPDFLIHVNL